MVLAMTWKTTGELIYNKVNLSLVLHIHCINKVGWFSKLWDTHPGGHTSQPPPGSDLAMEPYGAYLMIMVYRGRVRLTTCWVDAGVIHSLRVWMERGSKIFLCATSCLRQKGVIPLHLFSVIAVNLSFASGYPHICIYLWKKALDFSSLVTILNKWSPSLHGNSGKLSLTCLSYLMNFFL